MSTSSISTTSRMLGMSSGIDTASIVKSLMKAEQLKIDKVFRQRTRLEWNKDAQLGFRSKISAFRNATMSVLSPETNIYSSSAFNTLQVVIPQTSTSIQITAGTSAIIGQHQIDSITRIATGSNTQSAQTVTSSEILNTNTTLENLSLEIPLQFGGIDSDTVSFDINGEEFLFKKTDSLQTVINTINYSKAGVRFSYSELTNKFNLQSTATGAATQIEIQNNLGNLFGTGSAIKMMDGIIQNGQDALLQIDGVELTRSTNNFSIDGLNYSLLANATTAITYRVEQNTAPTVDKIKNFLKLYNQLVTDLQATVDEKKNYNYEPLTQEEKESMTEKEIELWETKAKSGQFRNDRSLTSLLSNMRQMFFDTVSGVGKSLSQIGFETGSYKDKGKIYFDETKFKTALNENPNLVSQLFIKVSTSTDITTKYNESGLIPKMINRFSQYNGLFSESTVDQEIVKISDKIDTINTQLYNKEEYYYKKFAAMEQALASMQTQSNWLTQQFSTSS